MTFLRCPRSRTRTVSALSTRLFVVGLATGIAGASEYLIPFFFETNWPYIPRSILTPLLALLLVALICSIPLLRPIFALSWKTDWTMIIPILFVLNNLAFICASFWRAHPHNSIFAIVQYAIYGAATGLIEEVCFRGIAFLGDPALQPKVAVATSTVAFVAIHLVGIALGFPLQRIVQTMAFAIPMGVLFGVIRLATGSLAWPALLHMAINASSYAGIASGFPATRTPAGNVLFASMTLCACIAFCAHPSMIAARGRVR